MFKTRLLALSVCALLSVGCSGIGDGSKIETLRLVQNTAQPNVAATAFDTFTCVRSSLTAVGEFTRGDIGNFSSRAKWTSSHPDILRVTNVGEPVGDGSGDVFLVGGVLLPQMASDQAVTIRADYFGLQADVQVTVRAATEARIVPSVARIVPNSSVQYVVRAKLDGVDTDLSSLATLSFVEADDAVAILDASFFGVVRGVAASPDPLLLEADMGVPCPGLQQATAIVAEPVGNLQLSFEDGYETGVDPDSGLMTGKLAEATSQFLRLRAFFGDFVNDAGEPVPDGDQDDEGEFQDLSDQSGANFGYDADGDFGQPGGGCELRLEGTPVLASAPLFFRTSVFGVFSGQSVVSAVPDTDANGFTTTICADFGGRSATTGTDPQPASNGILSNPLTLTVVDAPLMANDGAGDEGLVLSASDPCDPDEATCEPLDPPIADSGAPVVKSGAVLLINALGTFVSDPVYTQNVNKNVTFTSSNTALAAVVTGVVRTAGIVVTASDLDAVEGCEAQLALSDSCTATITATWTGATVETTDDVSATIAIVVERAAGDTPPAE